MATASSWSWKEAGQTACLLVQSWLALGSAWNYGLELAPGAPGTSVSFDSKESGARGAFIDVALAGGEGSGIR